MYYACVVVSMVLSFVVKQLFNFLTAPLPPVQRF
jgi:hypothetical protein